MIYTQLTNGLCNCAKAKCVIIMQLSSSPVRKLLVKGYIAPKPCSRVIIMQLTSLLILVTAWETSFLSFILLKVSFTICTLFRMLRSIFCCHERGVLPTSLCERYNNSHIDCRFDNCLCAFDPLKVSKRIRNKIETI